MLIGSVQVASLVWLRALDNMKQLLSNNIRAGVCASNLTLVCAVAIIVFLAGVAPLFAEDQTAGYKLGPEDVITVTVVIAVVDLHHARPPVAGPGSTARRVYGPNSSDAALAFAASGRRS